MKKVAIYSRKSLETDKGDSIKNQIDICKEYFLRHDSNVKFEIFQDEGFSGGNTNRPSFQMLLNRIKDFDAVACYKIDRIARNIVDFVNIYSKLEKNNVKLISVTEGFDPSTPIGKMMMMILASFAEMERMNISQRVKDNMRELAKHGKWTGGTIPFGYTTERVEENGKKSTNLKLDESKIDLINNIFNYYIKASSMHQVQKWLYGNDIKWCLSTVKNILTSPVYVKADTKVINFLKNSGEVFGKPDSIHGILSYNRRPYTNGKHRWNDESMFYSIAKHEGIIDADLWLKVQMLQEKNKTSPRPKKSQVSYFTGILKCAKCGSLMTVSYNHKNADGSITYCYLCTGRKSYGKEFCDCSQVKQKILDKEIEDTLKMYATDKKAFMRLFTKKKTSNKGDETIKLQKRIKNNLTKITNLADKVAELDSDASVIFMNKIKTLSSENEELRKELLFLQQDSINSELKSPEVLYENLNTFIDIIDKLDIDDKREMIKNIIKEIQWDSDQQQVQVIL